MLGMRFDINDMNIVKQVVGVQINFDGDKYSGFDTDGEYSRIFMGWSYAKLGIGSTIWQTQTRAKNGTFCRFPSGRRIAIALRATEPSTGIGY